LKAPLESRFTMELPVFTLVGGTVQLNPRVPLPVTGEPVTTKSEAGALSPTLVTVPDPPGKTWPDAKVIWPLLAIFSPVSAGFAVPVPKRRFKVPLGVAVSLPDGSACHSNTWSNAALVLLLNTDAFSFCGCEFFPDVAVAVPVAGKFSAP